MSNEMLLSGSSAGANLPTLLLQGTRTPKALTLRTLKALTFRTPKDLTVWIPKDLTLLPMQIAADSHVVKTVPVLWTCYGQNNVHQPCRDCAAEV